LVAPGEDVRDIGGARFVVGEVGRGERVGRARRRDARKLDQIVRRADAAKRREQQRLGDAEKRDAGADPDRERKRGEEREAGIRRELARGVAELVRKELQHAASFSEAEFRAGQAFDAAGLRISRWSSSWRRRCIVSSSTTRPSNMKILRCAKSA
jgi:hypothetical protein